MSNLVGTSDPVKTSAPASSEITTPHLTDMGNAQRFTRLFRGVLRYCDPLRAWFVFDGRRWQEDTTRDVMRRAKAAVTTIYTEAASAPSAAERKAIATWAQQSEGEPRLNAMVSLARAELAITPDALDAHPWFLNVLNGTLDLRTGELRPHRATDLITKLAPVRYDADARSELWTRVLGHALPEAAVRQFAQKLAGYTLVGITGEDVMVILHGPTRTSKGTVQEAIATMLGDYAITAELDLLAERDHSGGPRPELVRLKGARIVSVYETSRRLKLSASLVKTLAGSDPITARGLHAKPITFRPELKLWLATNHRPNAPSDDDALWERIRELPFTNTVPEDERDPDVRAQLRDPAQHGAAILAWAVEGCRPEGNQGLPRRNGPASRLYRRLLRDGAGAVGAKCPTASGIRAMGAPERRGAS